MNVRITDGTAKVVGCFGGDGDGFSSKIGVAGGRDRYLELGRLVFGDPEAGAGIELEIRLPDIYIVVAQRRLFVQNQFVIDGPHVAEG